MDNKIMIVDEQTGRIMDGRRYSDGLHQAIEAKENVKSTATQTFATVTAKIFQNVQQTRRNDWTTVTEAGELWQIYKRCSEILLTEAFQEKTKKILSIKQHVKNSMLLLKM
jgi:preprotein translocase subunit SecA